jgi:hypothetical protein
LPMPVRQKHANSDEHENDNGPHQGTLTFDAAV